LVVAIGTTKAVVLHRGLEIPHDLIALAGGGVDGNQIIVMEADAIGADFAQHVANLRRRDALAHRLAERIAAGIADGPKTEAEFHFGIGFDAGHGFLVRSKNLYEFRRGSLFERPFRSKIYCGSGVLARRILPNWAVGEYNHPAKNCADVYATRIAQTRAVI
jgi:hypothetical protein